MEEEIISRFGLSRSRIDRQTPLFSSGLLDSFNMIEMVVLIEQTTRTKLRIADICLENLDTIERIENLIAKVRQ
jgi:acyl carrier protein